MYSIDVLKIMKLLASQGFYSDSLFFSKMEYYDKYFNVTMQSTSNPRMKKSIMFSDSVFEAEHEFTTFIKMVDSNRLLKRWLQDSVKVKKLPIRIFGTELPEHFEVSSEMKITPEIILELNHLMTIKKFTWGMRCSIARIEYAQKDS